MRSSTRLHLPLLLPAFLVLTVASIVPRLSPQASAQSTFYDRNDVPGHYSLGFYADELGSSHQITLGRDEDSFECYLGITGDSTRVFSAVVFRLELPAEISLDGPVRWYSIPGLKQSGQLTGSPGIQVEFSKACQEQKGPRPVMIGRIRFKVSPRFEEGVIVPQKHVNFGLSVELCDDERSWPKPFAEPVALTVKRKSSFWARLKGIFG